MSRGIRSGGGAPKSLVTYYVDTGESYQEKVDYGLTILSPTTFTPTKTGYTFRGWREDNTPSGNVLTNTVAKGKKYYLYAVFERTITVTYYDLSTAASSTTDYEYYNNTNTSDPPEFTLTQKAYSGWTERGWTTSSSGGASTITYQNGVPFTRTSNITLYGCYQKTVTVTYNANGGTGTTANSTGTAYHHSTSGATNATIALRTSGYSKTNYVFANWRLNNPNGTAYNAGSNYVSTADCTMYAYWVVPAIITAGVPQSGYSMMISSASIVLDNPNYRWHSDATPPGTYAPVTTASEAYTGSMTIYGRIFMDIFPYHPNQTDDVETSHYTYTITFNNNAVGRRINATVLFQNADRWPGNTVSRVTYNGTTLYESTDSNKYWSTNVSFTVVSGGSLVLYGSIGGRTLGWAASLSCGINSMTIA